MVTGYSPYHWLIGHPPHSYWLLPISLAYRETPPHGYWLLPISLAYWATPHIVTGKSPYHWLVGQPPTWLLVTPHITGL